MPARGSHRPVACSLAQLIGRRVSILLLDPLAFFVFLVLLLDGAPGHPVAAILLVVLLLGGVVRRPVDLLGVLGRLSLTLSGRSVSFSYGMPPPSLYVASLQDLSVPDVARQAPGPLRICRRSKRLSSTSLELGYLYAALGAVDEDITPHITLYDGLC